MDIDVTDVINNLSTQIADYAQKLAVSEARASALEKELENKKESE